MNRTIHEIIVDGDTVRLRTRIDDPVRDYSGMPNYIYHDTALPHHDAARIRNLIGLHDECLARTVGAKWLESQATESPSDKVTESLSVTRDVTDRES